jgi:uncharacterized Fe-S cluster-containing radical SAM superfamily protein
MREKNYDPVQKAEGEAKVVLRGDLRKYYRFRPARFYGGIATADCLGCCLRCIYCWSWQELVRPDSYGQFYSPKQVAEKLTSIALKKGFHQVRISGNEPTITKDHLLKVLENIPAHFQFVLETNGILLGHDQSYAKDLARFPNLYVRVSFKGTNEEEFSRLTGAKPTGFHLQLQALENLFRSGVKVHPAVMVSFSPKENAQTLQKRLKEIHPSFEDFEVEELVFWGKVAERLEKAGIDYRSAYQPEGIPPEQV